MKKVNFKLTCILIIVCSLFLGLIVYTTNKCFSDLSINSKISNYKTGNTSLVLTKGTYTSSDNHTITILEDGTILYDETYSLTVSSSTKGSVLTGKIGTNNKSVTFYQLNSQAIVSSGVVNYIHNGETIYLYDYTVFSLDDVITQTDESGSYEVWTSGSKVGTYDDLQHAINSAASGSTIKITKSIDILSGAYVRGKTLTIDGMENTITRNNYLNSIFVVESDATLNLKNLTIDGGASGFEVDYDAVTFTNFTIPLKSDSYTNDLKQNLSAIISKGTLNINKVNMNNNYNSTSTGGTISVISGNLIVNNSTFTHNRASNGGAILIGSNFKVNETSYPVSEVSIKNTNFEKNYSSNGGAIYIYNTASVNFESNNFISNTVTGGYGGAIMITKQGTNDEKLGLDFVQAKINDCVFDGNWAGNDGFAIQNNDAELTTTNSVFKNNVGVHPTSSVATSSMQVIRNKWATEKIISSVFEKNRGAISGIGDHGGHVFLTIDDCKFNGNIANVTLYFLTSIITIKNSEFTNEKVNRAVVEAASNSEASEYDNIDYDAPTVIIEDCDFKNNDNVAVQARFIDYEMKHHLEVNGVVNGNINMLNGTQLTVNGTLNGDINTDRETSKENIIISQTGKVNGNVTYNTNSYRVNIRYYDEDEDQIVGYSQVVLFLEENKTYTEKELYLLHLIGGEKEKLQYYTDSAMTKPWDFTVTKNLTIYTKFVEHTHSYDGGLVVHENAIYEQCECGYLGKSIYLKEPEKLVYDTNSKPVIVVNELGINNYELSYKQKNFDGTYEEINTNEPIFAGEYKAILTYEDKVIELEYEITEAIEDCENPETSDGLIALIAVILISISCSVVLVNKYNKLMRI